MDVKEFKHMLFEGAVSFSFKKTDGTIRKAKGTMCKSLLPKDDPYVKRFIVKGITWPDEAEGLRKAYKIGLKQCDIDKYGEDAIEDAVRDALVARTGFSPLGFILEDVTTIYASSRTMPPGHTLFYDLERGGFRSLIDSALVSFEKA